MKKTIKLLSVFCLITLITVHIYATFLIRGGTLPNLILAFTITLIPIITIIYFNSLNNVLVKTIINMISIPSLVLLMISDLLLVAYGFYTTVHFDFYFFWYNITNTYEVLSSTFSNFEIYLLLCISIIILSINGLYIAIKVQNQFQNTIRKNYLVNSLLSLSLIIVSITSLSLFEITNVMANALNNESKLLSIYQNYYLKSLEQNKKNRSNNVVLTESEDIYFFQLESLNGLLINDQNTPKLINASKNGLFLKNIQAASVLTGRSQEVILCSILPVLKSPTAQSLILRDGLYCLPEIFKAHGYKTIYIQNYPNLKFDFIDNFMKFIGFEQVLSSEIMQPDDKYLPWGYAEDIFYQRVFEYLEKLDDQKKFVYISVAASNHHPFYSDEVREHYTHLIPELPYSNAVSHKERMSNTTFIQDKIWGNAYEKYLADKKYKTNTVVFGDHSFPLGIHDGNIFHSNNAWQENFITTFLLIPSDNFKKKLTDQHKAETIFSQLDILPSILQLYGANNFKYAGESFINQNILNQTQCKISVQPFSDRFITIIKYPFKKIYNLNQNSVVKYNLNEDPNESSPMESNIIIDSDINELTMCLESLSDYENSE